MDEKQLAELFNDAVRDVPPPTFGTGEVRRASHRATVRRRNTIVAGAAAAFVVLAGGTVTTLALTGESGDTAAVSAPALGGAARPNSGTMYNEGSALSPAAPSARADSQGPQDTREGPPKQGGGSTGNAGAAGSTPSGCKADRELAAALAGELPAAAPRTELADVPFGCPPGARGGAIRLDQGTLSVVLVPPGVDPGIAPLGSNVSGYASTETTTASGAAIFVVSQPAPGVAEPPFVNDIARYATEIGKGH